MALNTRFNAKNGLSVGIPNIPAIDGSNNATFASVSARQYFGLQPSLSGVVALVNGNSLGSNLLIGTNDNFNLNLETDGTTRMTITSAGLVGVGTVNPVSPLHLISGINSNIYLGTSATNDGIHEIRFGFIPAPTNSYAASIVGIRTGGNGRGNLEFRVAGGGDSTNAIQSDTGIRITSADVQILKPLVYAQDVLAIGDNYNSGVKAFKFTRSENKAAIWSVPVGGYGNGDIRFTTGNEASAVPKTESDATFIISRNGGVVVGNSYIAQYPTNGNLLVQNSIGIGTTAPVAKLDIADTTLAGSGGLSGAALNITQTWATSGVPTAIKLNVTDTSSSASSLLMDLQIGSRSSYSFGKTTLTLPPSATSGIVWPGVSVQNTTCSITRAADDTLAIFAGLGSGKYISVGGNGYGLSIFNSYVNINTGLRDVRLSVDDHNILAQRNGTSAQTFRLYNTYTDATTFERLNIKWDTNILRFQTEKGSVGGTTRSIQFFMDGSTRMAISPTSLVTVADETGTQQRVLNNYACLNNSYSASTAAASTPWLLDAATNDILHGYTTRLTVTNTGTAAASGVFTQTIEWPLSELTDVNGMVYAEGTAILRCYYLQNAQSVRFRLWNNSASAWGSWYTATNITGDSQWGVWRASLGGNYLTKFEWETTSPPGNSTNVMSVEYYPTRSNSGIRFPHKFAAQGASKLLIGGGTSGYCSIVGSGTTLKVRNGNDSADGSITAAAGIFSTTLSVVGSISSSNVVYASGGNSNIWNSTYATVTAVSANSASIYTTVNSNSAAWSSVYTLTNANSAKWDSTHSTTNTLSSAWQSSYTTTNTNSAAWNSVYSSYNSASANLVTANSSPTFTNLSVSGSLSVQGDLTYLNTNVSVTSALSVVNTGTGPALYVRQTGTQPIAHFIDADGTGDIIFDNNGFVGLGTATPSQRLTVVGNISSSSVIYASGGNSNLWNSAYTSVNAISSNGASAFTTVNANSANWSSVYTTTNSNSAAWSSVYTLANANSAKWDSTHSTTNTLSSTWQSGYTTTNANSANWSSVYTTTNSNSANYVLDGGNSKGATLVIGTNDGFDLSLETNGVERAKITSGGLFSADGVSFGKGGGSGLGCIAIGQGSLVSNSLGIDNVSIGVDALAFSEVGSNNVALGTNSLFNTTSGAENMAIGNSAIFSNTAGNQNTAIGSTTLYYNVTGSNNIAIGSFAGSETAGALSVTDISSSVFIGTLTKPYNAAGDTNSVIIGDSAGGMGSNTVVLGNNSITNTYLKGTVQLHRSNADPVNYERLAMRWNSLVATIGTSQLGTGVARALALETGGTTKMTVTSGGNVGIGTTTPDADLVVYKNVIGTPATLKVRTATGTASRLDFYRTDAYVATRFDVLSTNEFQFFNNNDVATPKYIVNGTNGNFGIGTTNTAEKVTIGGNLSASGILYGNSVVLPVGGSANWNSVYTTVNTASATYILAGGNTRGADVVIGTNDSFNLTLETGGTNRWNISTAGHLLAATDNTYDIGASGANRPRNMYISGSASVSGHFSAATKSFIIPHPTKPDKKLQYACLEGPENGVYVRGKTDESIITLPDYWSELVDVDSITVTVTPIGKPQQLYVVSQDSTSVEIGNVDGLYNYTIFGERKDVNKLQTEI